VRRTITDRLLGLSKKDWNKINLDAVAKARKEEASAKAKASQTRVAKGMTHDKKDYEGVYNHPGYGNLDVYLQNDSLFMRTAKQNMWLMNWHYDVFYPMEAEPGEKIDTAEKGGISFRFNTDLNGDIESLNAYGFEAPTIQLEFKKTPKAKAITKAELESYTGDYSLAGTTVKVYIKAENTLTVEVPGQPPYELVPVGNHKFSFKAMQGFSLVFDKKEGEPATALTFMQPNGNFKAERKK
jgi:hypothetical protein